MLAEAAAAVTLSFVHLAWPQRNCPDVMARPLAFRRPPKGAARQIKRGALVLLKTLPP